MTQRDCFAVRKIHVLKLILLTKHCPKLVVEVSDNTNKSNKNTNLVTKVALNTYKTGG